MLGLQLEVGADIGRALEQTVERRPIRAAAPARRCWRAPSPDVSRRRAVRPRRSCRRRAGCSAESHRRCPRA
jgi:hypothetical protein